MELLLSRRLKLPNRTIGGLYLDNKLFTYTLEDTVREAENEPVPVWKIQNQTAIPHGRYEIVRENSPKFGPDTLTLKHVDGFLFIRIHSGNDEGDTDGCILVGTSLSPSFLLVESKLALKKLKDALAPLFAKGERIYLTVETDFSSSSIPQILDNK